MEKKANVYKTGMRESKKIGFKDFELWILKTLQTCGGDGKKLQLQRTIKLRHVFENEELPEAWGSRQMEKGK